MHILTFVVLLGLLIFMHEFGHFWMARKSGIIVEEFGIGLPPKILHLFNWRGTEFTLNLLPLGGFARMKGEDHPEGEGSFYQASMKGRALTLLAGPATNILFSIVLLATVYMIAYPVGAHIQKVVPDTPAAQAGLRANDVILDIMDQGGHRHMVPRSGLPKMMQPLVASSPNGVIRLVVMRNGREVIVPVKPALRNNMYELGVYIDGGSPYFVHLPVLKAVQYAWSDLANFVVETLTLPAKLLRHSLSAQDARLTGPVGIYRVTNQIVKAQPTPQDKTFAIAWILSIISMALGLTNLLPLPALDGGRLAFIVLEAVRRGKRIPPEKEGLVHAVGMALLLVAMVVITYYDFTMPMP